MDTFLNIVVTVVLLAVVWRGFKAYIQDFKNFLFMLKRPDARNHEMKVQVASDHGRNECDSITADN